MTIFATPVNIISGALLKIMSSNNDCPRDKSHYYLKMKTYSEQQVDDMIKLKFGQLVTTPHHRSYASNKLLGKLFGCSGSKIRQLYMAKFETIKMKQQPLID